jgi:hypothetical protein
MPMRIAVQTQADGSPSAALLHGTRHATREGGLRPVALFEAGQLAAYHLRGQRREHLFVSLGANDPRVAQVPGAQLLLDPDSRGRIRLANILFARLRRKGQRLVALPDDFFVARASPSPGAMPAQPSDRSTA